MTLANFSSGQTSKASRSTPSDFGRRVDSSASSARMNGRQCTARAVNLQRDSDVGGIPSSFGCFPARDARFVRFRSTTGLTRRDSHGLRIAGIAPGTRNRPYGRGFHSSHFGGRSALRRCRINLSPLAEACGGDRSIRECETELSSSRIAFGRPRTGRTMRARKPCSPEGTLKRKEAQEGAGLQRRKRSWRIPDLNNGARPRSRRSEPSHPHESWTRQRNQSSEGGDSERTARWQGAAVTRHPPLSGISSKGRSCIAGKCRLEPVYRSDGTET
jgi:hypothetical protein